MNQPEEQHIIDADTLPPGELRKKYRLTYSSWAKRKNFCASHDGWTWSPAFDEFREFLRIVGPRPSKNHTLDRLDNSKKVYGPGLVAWRTVTEQNQNKSDNVLLTHNGATKSLSAWATEMGVPVGTMRARRDRGWSVPEIIEGRAAGLATIRKDLPWPAQEWERFERNYRRAALAGDIPDDMDRLSYLLELSRQRVTKLTAGLQDVQFEDGEEIPADYQAKVAELNRWESYLAHARHQIEERQRQRRFVRRKGGLGVRKEQLLLAALRDEGANDAE